MGCGQRVETLQLLWITGSHNFVEATAVKWLYQICLEVFVGLQLPDRCPQLCFVKGLSPLRFDLHNRGIRAQFKGALFNGYKTGQTGRKLYAVCKEKAKPS